MNELSETLLAKMARLQAENTRLRRIAQHTGDAARLERIETDARQLLVWRFSGFGISQRAAQSYGMSRRAWQWARGLLMLAGLHDGSDLVCSDFSDALEALDRAVARVQAEGLDRLKFILPTHCTLENWYKRVRNTACNTPCNTARQGVSNDASNSYTHSTDNRAAGGYASSGAGRDRRREIEERQGVRL